MVRHVLHLHEWFCYAVTRIRILFTRPVCTYITLLDRCCESCHGSCDVMYFFLFSSVASTDETTQSPTRGHNRARGHHVCTALLPRAAAAAAALKLARRLFGTCIPQRRADGLSPKSCLLRCFSAMLPLPPSSRASSSSSPGETSSSRVEHCSQYHVHALRA